MRENTPDWGHETLGEVNIRIQREDAEALEAVVDKKRDSGTGWGYYTLNGRLGEIWVRDSGSRVCEVV